MLDTSRKKDVSMFVSDTDMILVITCNLFIFQIIIMSKCHVRCSCLCFIACWTQSKFSLPVGYSTHGLKLHSATAIATSRLRNCGVISNHTFSRIRNHITQFHTCFFKYFHQISKFMNPKTQFTMKNLNIKYFLSIKIHAATTAIRIATTAMPTIATPATATAI